MSNWVRVACAKDVLPGTACETVAGDRMVALFNVDGEIFALDGVCPHQGGPLGQGQLSGCVVTCPWHGWQFDVRNGEHQINANLKHATFPVKIEEDDVLVELPAEG